MALSDVTATELARLVRDEMTGGYDQTEKGEGRRRLLEVVEEIAATEGDRPRDEVLSGRIWRIADVAIEGIGGIAAMAPAALSFTPKPGITVVRSPNGHGKTSIARAVDCALRGSSDVSTEQAGELWSAELLTAGEQVGEVVVTLAEERGAVLRIGALFDSAAPATVTATLTDAAGAREVSLDEAWRSALAAARAHFSYGALQTRLHDIKELQSYLEELLVLGPVWGRVRSAVDTRADRAVAAKREVDAALKRARAREAELVEEYRDHEGAPTAPGGIAWPKVANGFDLDAWVHATGLSAVEPAPGVRVAPDHEERVLGLDAALRDSDARLADADRAIDAPGVARALHHLEKLVEVDELDDGTCPLCGSATNWRRHARELTEGLRSRQQAANDVQVVMTELRTWIEAELLPLLDAGATEGRRAVVTAFLAATADGCQAHSSAHRSARPLLDELLGDDHGQWLRQLREATDATAEWRSALMTVVHEFAAEVRGHVGAAPDAGAWKKAQGTLDELQLGLRQRRQDDITGAMNEAVARLLPDAAIDLGAINHQGGVKQARGVKVDLALADRPATLGMLSGGQRNALLLTPLVVLEDPGPFGFLLVDDPVHALDDIRVDLLAVELVRLAEHRQVIVLTHDPRLEEHLRARHRATSVIELQRDPVSRTVAWTTVDDPWGRLLADARAVHDLHRAEHWAYSEPVASVVGGLCRDALDGAIRQAVINRAWERRESEDAALAELGRAKATRDRIDLVTGLAGGPDALPALAVVRRQHMETLNQGSHGRLEDSFDPQPVITAVSRACVELVRCSWSGN